MKTDAKAILYDQSNGKIKPIEKSEVCELLKSFKLKESMTYKEIAEKCKFNKVTNGIYNLKNNNSTKLIFLIDKTLDEFKGFLKKNNLPVFEENSIILYHGSPYPILRPKYKGGTDDNDYGNGLYLTPYLELAREWSASKYNKTKKSYVYKLEIDLSGLNILDFDKESELAWLAELMYNRPVNIGVAYRRFAPLFIKKYKINTDNYDIIKGWRADSSYYDAVRDFIRGDLDMSLIKDSFHIGDLGIQYFIKSQKAFNRLEKEYKPFETLSYEVYHKKYMKRDNEAKIQLEKIKNSDKNTLKDTFRKYIEE